jgi:hypothetical protein
MTTHPFLSESWIDAVTALKEAHAENRVAEAGFCVNATITGVPFGDGTLHIHSDTGPMVGWEPGHRDGADLEMTLDYHTARALILDPSPGFDALSAALANGTLVVTGDRERLEHWWRSRVSNPEAVALEEAVRALTT